MTRRRSLRVLIAEESDKLLDQEKVTREAIAAVEQNGIVFIDEIDKIAAPQRAALGADVSREGVQRDLLPLIEGTTVATKHGPVKTDHVLFIASGAFHLAKPSDLLPELQGRLPIRVELKALTRDDFRAHPDRARSQPDQAIPGAAGDRGRRRSTSPTRRSTRSPALGRADQRAASRISARAACRRCWSGCSRRSASPPPTSARHSVTIDRRLCARARRRARQERRSVEVHPLMRDWR